jgi:hypothetical protein
MDSETLRIARQSEVDRLSAQHTRMAEQTGSPWQRAQAARSLAVFGRGARYSHTELELDPDQHMGHDIVVEGIADTALSRGRDAQRADLLSYDDVREATAELARLRGEPQWKTQQTLLALSGGERDVLSMAEAVSRLVTEGSSSAPGAVSDAQYSLALTYATEDATGRPVDRAAARDDLIALSHTGDLESELAIAMAGPGWDATEIASIARRHGLPAALSSSDVAGAGRGDADEVALRLALADSQLAPQLDDNGDEDEPFEPGPDGSTRLPAILSDDAVHQPSLLRVHRLNRPGELSAMSGGLILLPMTVLSGLIADRSRNRTWSL